MDIAFERRAMEIFDDALMLPAEERNKTFQSKPVWQRALIVLAGPVTNFIVAILILAAFAMTIGVNRTPPVAGAVTPESAAAKAGFEAGDRVRSVNGRTVSDFGDFAEFVVARPNQALSVEIERAGQPRTISVTPETHYRVDRFGNKYPFGRLGIASPRPVIERVGVLEAPVVAVEQTVGIVRARRQCRVAEARQVGHQHFAAGGSQGLDVAHPVRPTAAAAVQQHHGRARTPAVPDDAAVAARGLFPARARAQVFDLRAQAGRHQPAMVASAATAKG